MVTEIAKRVSRALYDMLPACDSNALKAQIFGLAKRSSSATGLAAMITLARGIDGVIIDHEELDANPYILNVANGTIDLRTGQLRPASPSDLCLKQSPARYEPDALAPRWEQCLVDWQPDADVREYLQLRTGAGATGIATSTVDFDIGPGGNGKSVFHTAIRNVLADYATEPHKSLLIQERHEQHATVVASLFGIRYAVAAETSANAHLDEASIKNLTGGDRLKARRMREDEWHFDPTHTLIMFSNYPPRITGTDEGIWRRVRMVTWDARITEPDERLGEKLRAESAGILRWIVDGARRFLADGWQVPPAVQVATKDYRTTEDTTSRFFAECCRFGEGWFAMADQLRARYEEWCRENDVNPRSARNIGDELIKRGAVKAPTGRKRWNGVGLLVDDDETSLA